VIHFIVALTVAAVAALPSPRFEEYPVDSGGPASVTQLVGPDLASHPEARQYRTTLRRETKAGPNFAGHFSLVRIGCGSSCAFLAVVDRLTGRVHFPHEFGPLSWSGWPGDDYGYTFRADSRLVRACGDPGESGRPACYYYLWSDDHASLLMKRP
jgi:hypothetical protein